MAQLGKRKSQQRAVILRVICESPGPITVNDIFERAQADCENLGIATVYRNIKLLLEKEQIQAVTLSDGQTRYEAADLGHHDHFHCTVCEAIIDLPDCALSMPVGTMLPNGFIVNGHDITLRGICDKCNAAS